MPEDWKNLIWLERIKRARKTAGRFTIEDKILVRSWNTCPVGERASAHTSTRFQEIFDAYALPDDMEIYGKRFLDAVHSNDVMRAESILRTIYNQPMWKS